MRFYILSDLHLGNKTDAKEAFNRLSKLCRVIRSETSPLEEVLFIVLGDIADKGSMLSFDTACECLDLICHELENLSVKFEFVPGNHDFEKDNPNLETFDKLTSKYGSTHSFNEKSAYSRVYGNVNFIFADSTTSRVHNAPGKLVISDIKAEYKPNISNILFCHHALTHGHGGTHDTIENPSEIKTQLDSLPISFLFHGHTHRSDVTIPEKGLVEIGCGSISADISWNNSLFHQFTTGCIQDGNITFIERFVDTIESDGFAEQQLYPYKQSFADPNTVLKVCYNEVENYIPRTVSNHGQAMLDSLTAAFLNEPHTTLLESVKKQNRILLLSDAGMGKSLEIQNLAYQLHRQMHTFVFSLKDYSNQDIIDIIPEHYKNLSPNRYALLFDGYDELDTSSKQEFEKKIRLFIKQFPGAHIVITARSNFCHIKWNKCVELSDFEVLVLDKLNAKDIHAFFEKNNIDIDAFTALARAKKVFDLLSNPFYLGKLVDIFTKENDLPQKNELMEKLVQVSFDVDDLKQSGNLNDNYKKLFSHLEAVAFAMQLMKKQNFDDHNEYQELFSGDAHVLAKSSGLINRKEEKWSFTHNNFREYLAARYLSKISQETALSIISDGKGIKANWVNTLGYLTGLEIKWDLFEWLSKNAPEALVKFEHDRLPADIRNDVFKRIFCKYEDLALNFYDELCDESDLANFANSSDILSFLIDRIKNPRNIPSQYSAAKILLHYPSMFTLSKEVKECLVECCEKYPSTPNYVCRVCLVALSQLNLADSELTQHLIDLFGQSEDDYIRLGMYEYLVERNEHNTYAQFFLDGIKYVQYRLGSDRNRIGNELFELINGLNSMSSVESVSLVINYYVKEKHLHFFESEKIIATIVDTAAQLYTSGHYEMYDVAISAYVQAATTWNQTLSSALTQFFNKTDTFCSALVLIADNFADTPNNIADLVISNLNSMECLKNAYLEDKLESPNTFHSMVDCYVRDLEKYGEYAAIIKHKEGLDLPAFKSPINYEALRTVAIREYFDAIFDENKRATMLDELVSMIGDDNIVVESLLDPKVRIDYKLPHWHLQSAIYRYAPPEVKVSGFFDYCDLDDFIINVTSDIIKSYPNFAIYPNQGDMIVEIINNQIEKNIFVDAVSYHDNGCSVICPVTELLHLILHLDYELHEKTLLQLTELPTFVFNGNKDDKKYEYLESKLNKEQIKERLIDNVKNGRVKDMVLKDHFNYFCKERDSSLASYALEVCKESAEFSSLRRSAWEYLYNVFGAEFFTSEVIPYANGEFLIEINSVCKDISREQMRIRMEEEYGKHSNAQLLAHMIILGSEMGLEEYVRYLKDNKRPPENNYGGFDGPTEAIATISNPGMLHYLEELLIVTLDDGFKDLSWSGLTSTLTTAFINCGKIAPVEAITIVEKHKPSVEENEDKYRRCNYIVNEIEIACRAMLDVTPTLDEVKEFLALYNV